MQGVWVEAGRRGEEAGERLRRGEVAASNYVAGLRSFGSRIASINCLRGARATLLSTGRCERERERNGVEAHGVGAANEEAGGVNRISEARKKARPVMDC